MPGYVAKALAGLTKSQLGEIREELETERTEVKATYAVLTRELNQIDEAIEQALDDAPAARPSSSKGKPKSKSSSKTKKAPAPAPVAETNGGEPTEDEEDEVDVEDVEVVEED